MTEQAPRPLAPDRAAGRRAGLPGLVAAMVPALAAAVTASDALWLSAAALLALTLAVLVAALLAARRVPPAPGSLAVLLTVAGLAGGADLAVSRWLPAAHADLGIYLPLAMVAVSGPVAAAVLEDAREEHRARRAASRALAAGCAFVAGVGLTAVVREALGAGTISLPNAALHRIARLPAIAVAPARGLLEPFAALIAAGYLAGLAVLVVRRAARRRGAGTEKEGPR